MYQNSDQHIANLQKARDKAHKEKRNCQHCNKLVPICGISRHEKCCYLNPINLKPCPNCQKPIKNYNTSLTCGYSCSNTLFRTGRANGSWKDSVYRTTCFLHHTKECVVCKENLIVEVHHLDEDNSNNSPDNLIPLCPTHHKYWHSRHKHLVEFRVTEYINEWKKKQTKPID